MSRNIVQSFINRYEISTYFNNFFAHSRFYAETSTKMDNDFFDIR